MSRALADKVFLLEYEGGMNVMTPNLIGERQMIGDDLAVELSWGTGMSHEKIYGVTVVEYDPIAETTKRRRDLTKLFNGPGALARARSYIASLAEDDDEDEEEGDDDADLS